MNDMKSDTDKTDIMQSLKQLVETELSDILTIGIQSENIENFSKLVDIHKDIENEEYWKMKKEVCNMGYNYGNYYGDDDMNSYGRRGVPGTGRGRSRGRYRGPEEKIHEIMNYYGNYSEASDSANQGNYGAEEDSLRSLDSMLKCVSIFMDMLEDNANSQEEAQMIRHYRKKLSR